MAKADLLSSQALVSRQINEGIARLAAGTTAIPSTRPKQESPELFEPFPLTDMQEAYWVGRQDGLALGGTSIYSYRETELDRIDIKRLEEAWNALVKRHPMLRASITEDGRQRILPQTEAISFPVEDLRSLSCEARQERLDAIRSDMTRHRPSIGVWPLWEIRLSLIEADRARIHLGIDGILIDDRSYQILIQEWFILYEGQKEQLSELGFTFRDYVLEERNQRSGPAYAQALGYWLKRLENLPGAPQLPMRCDPAQISQPRFTRHALTLSAESWTKIKAICVREGITPPALILAAFMEVLARWSTSPALTINVPTFNRPPIHPQINDIIGEFGSFVLIGNEGLETLRFGERVKAVQQRLWDALDNSDVSGVSILREMARKSGAHDSVRMPVVFTMASNLRKAGQVPAKTQKQKAEVLFGITQTPQVILDHQVSERQGELYLNWDVVEAVFPEGMIADMFASFGNLLRDIEADRGIWSASCAAQLPAWQLQERTDANATQAPLPVTALHSAFDARAKLSPHRPAILTPDRCLTFAELDARAQAIALALIEAGVETGQIVAIVASKGWEQIAAAIAILRIGGVYLPIGADLPSLRREQLLAKSGARIALTQASLIYDFVWPADLHVIAITDHPADTAGIRPDRACDPDQPAYILYTSGSTGEPKGVTISHRAAVNTLHDVNARFGVTEADRVLGLSQLSFDLSVFDIFGVLGEGGALVLPAAGQELDPAAWLDLCERHGVTIWNSVPALLGVFMQHLEDQARALPPALRLTMLSGDWIPLDLPKRLRALSAQAVRLVSLGGATEAAIWSVWSPIEESLRPDWPSIPYGKPLLNQKLHVLHHDLSDCPVWVPGQLYIEGTGLALCYHRDETRTQRRFIIDAQHGGRRLYDTGDRARYRPGGDIEFLGREDRQVKVGGHRVDLREIELVIGQHADVESAAVLKTQAGQLHAFLIANKSMASAASLATIRSFIQERLPRYAVPLHMDWIERLPLSREGKVNIAALLPLIKSHDQSNAGVEQDSETLETLRILVETVTGRSGIDLTQGPIALGISSIELIRLSGLIRRDFGIALALADLLQISSLATLAQRLRTPAKDNQGHSSTQITAPATAPPSVPQTAFEPPDCSNLNVARLIRDSLGTGAGLRLLGGSSSADRLAQWRVRKSQRSFSLRPVSFEMLGRLLAPLCGTQDDDQMRFHYGSASGLYPVRVYCEIKAGRVNGLLPGLYVHDPLAHRLVERRTGDVASRELFGDKNRLVVDEAAFVLYLIGSMHEMQALYGQHAAILAMYEAGSIGQILRDHCRALGLGLCSIGTMDFAAFRDVAALSADDVFLHAIAGGRMLEAQPEPDRYMQTPTGQLASLADRLQALSDEEARQLHDALAVNGKAGNPA
jgi:amino acid adenylation domain-containing protein